MKYNFYDPKIVYEVLEAFHGKSQYSVKHEEGLMILNQFI